MCRVWVASSPGLDLSLPYNDAGEKINRGVNTRSCLALINDFFNASVYLSRIFIGEGGLGMRLECGYVKGRYMVNDTVLVWQLRMDVYFKRISDIIKKGKIPSRIKFMLQDVQDLRGNSWVPRVRQDKQLKTTDQEMIQLYLGASQDDGNIAWPSLECVSV